MPGHLFNLSKHSLKEQVNLLKMIEVLIHTKVGIPSATVWLPTTEKWDGFVFIPNISQTELMTAIARYGLIKDSEAYEVAKELGLDPANNPVYAKLPLASSWKNEYRIKLSDIADLLDTI